MQHWFSLSKRAYGQMQEVVCDGKDERGLCIYFLLWGLVCMPRCMCRGVEAVRGGWFSSHSVRLLGLNGVLRPGCRSPDLHCKSGPGRHILPLGSWGMLLVRVLLTVERQSPDQPAEEQDLVQPQEACLGSHWVDAKKPPSPVT